MVARGGEKKRKGREEGRRVGEEGEEEEGKKNNNKNEREGMRVKQGMRRKRKPVNERKRKG